MAIENGFGNAGSLRDFLGRRVLVAQLDEQLLGVEEELLLAIRLAQPRLCQSRMLAHGVPFYQRSRPNSATRLAVCRSRTHNRRESIDCTHEVTRTPSANC